MTVEEKLAQAFKETFDERTERVMKIEKKHRFSFAYRLWERKMLRDLRRGRCDECWTLKKARYAVVAMTTAFSLLIGGTAYASVALIGRYGFVDNIDYSKVLIETHPSDKTTLEEYYGLAEEDGWELVERDVVYFSSTSIYEHDDKKITFVQETIRSGTMGNISTDRAKIEPLSLYEENDGFVIEFDDNSLIYWIYDGYLFKISGNINKKEMIKLVYSTKNVEL